MSEPILLEDLTERELDIIPLLAEGLANKEIAERLFLAPSTVKWYVRQLNSKLDTTSREEISEQAEKLGLMHRKKTDDSYLRPRTNLPRQTTPFVGRDAELDEVHSIFENPDVRLLTILAPGGMGKTRIALEATEQQTNNFSDGVYFVPLQPLSEVEQIVSQIASSTFFNIQNDDRSQQQQLLDFLRNKQMLLCIDNWEHLLEGAPMLNEILAAAPDVKILTTSREKLNLLGETVYVLPGMKFPDWETPEDALRYDAVQLLVQAAKRVNRDWRVTQDNQDYVARVCRLTQGMPLGILLAASWLDTYPLKLICEEIQNSVDILETDLRDVPERQRSIRATFDYSWARLSDTERDILAKMSIFRGGSSPRAALAVTGANPRILQTLMNKSLLMRNKEGRYDIHELLRQYAAEKLTQSGGVERLRDDHMRYYMNALAEQYKPLQSAGQLEGMKAIRVDFENVRLAWERACSKHEYELLDNALFSLCFFLEHGGLSRHTGFEVFNIARKHLMDDTTAENRVVAKIACNFYPDDELRKTLVERSLALARRDHDLIEVGNCLCVLAEFAAFPASLNGDMERGIELAREAVDTLRGTDNQVRLCFAVFVLGTLLTRAGYRHEGFQYLEEALSIAVAQQIPVLESLALNVLGGMIGLGGDLERALVYIDRMLELGQILPLSGTLPMTILLKIHFEVTLGRTDGADQLIARAYQIAREIDADITILSAIKLMEKFLQVVRGEYEAALQDVDRVIVDMRPHPEAEFYNMYAGTAACGTGEFDRAIRYFSGGIRYGKQARSPFPLLIALIIPTFILAHRDQFVRATELSSLLYNHPVSPTTYFDMLPLYNDLIGTLHSALNEEEFNAAWERGRSLDLEAVIDDVLAEFGRVES